ESLVDAGGFAWLSTGAGTTREEVGLGLDDFGVVFAYPWPDEESVTGDLFERYASVGALLVTYHGGGGVRVRPKTAQAAQPPPPRPVASVRPRPHDASFRARRRLPLESRMPFKALGLHPTLVQATREMHYTEPTPIQARAIPAVLAGRDLIATAQTGTGKTE